MSIDSMIPELRQYDVRLVQETNGREAYQHKILSFGIPFLDEALKGIVSEDLIVMGAKTGIGKTQLAMHIAFHNARQGRNVIYFALEAAEYEIERRMKYQQVCDKFFSMPNRPQIHLNYLDWLYGDFLKELREIEKEIEQTSFLPQLRIYYRSKNFDVKEFQRVLLAVKEDTELVIIDHLHYFDHDDPNENKAVKEIVKTIKDMTAITKIPVILISHVRKTDRRLKTLVPDIEDFHGSSDIGKIATKAFCLSPGKYDATSNCKLTFINIQKCRDDGSRTGWTGCLAYNLTSQRYQREYVLGRMSIDSTEFETTETRQLPFWAVNARLTK